MLRNWDAIKRAEKAQPASSALDGIPRGLPALLEAAKLGSRAQKSGFDWPDVEGIFAKLEEETEELRQAIRASSATAGVASEEVVSEVGDMLFTMVNLARRLQVEPEFALRHTNGKFRRRFAAMEAASAQPLGVPVGRPAGIALEPGQARRKSCSGFLATMNPDPDSDPALRGLRGAQRLRATAGRSVGVWRPRCDSPPRVSSSARGSAAR